VGTVNFNCVKTRFDSPRGGGSKVLGYPIDFFWTELFGLRVLGIEGLGAGPKGCRGCPGFASGVIELDRCFRAPSVDCFYDLSIGFNVGIVPKSGTFFTNTPLWADTRSFTNDQTDAPLGSSAVVYLVETIDDSILTKAGIHTHRSHDDSISKLESTHMGGG
jgi:hypothetical protein